MLTTHDDVAEIETTDVPQDASATRVERGEVPFKIEDMLFTRTDKRGIIRSLNEIFQRISGYETSKLLGAPHKLVRHDDMPKAVFEILWKGIGEGRPIGAYVKNRAADGRYYWVFACVTPVEGGYLSVRLKPQSELFEFAKAEYEILRKQEKDEDLSAEDSAGRLLKRLKKAGYPDYLSFASKAAAMEISLRNEKLGIPENENRQRLNTILNAVEEVSKASAQVVQACERVDTLPTNMQVKSARLGAIAAPIGIIAGDCSERTRALMGQMLDFVDGTERATRAVNAAIFASCVTDIQTEMAASFDTTTDTPRELDFEDEKTYLAKRNRINQAEMIASIQDVNSQVRVFTTSAHTIDRAIVGLNVTRIMCGIESNILGEHADSIRDIVQNLGAFQTDAPVLLKGIERSIKIMKENIAIILQSESVSKST